MCIDAHVPRRARQTFMFSIRYVLIGFQVYVLFGKSEVDDVYDFFLIVRTSTDKEIFRFDVPVDEVPTMYVFYPMELQYNINCKYIANFHPYYIVLSYFQSNNPVWWEQVIIVDLMELYVRVNIFNWIFVESLGNYDALLYTKLYNVMLWRLATRNHCGEK